MRLSIRPLLFGAGLLFPALPGFAHLPIDMPGPAPTPAQAFVLPDAQASWNVYGLLQTPGQVDFIRLDNYSSDLSVGLAMRVFAKAPYATFAPSIAVLDPSLPPPPPPGALPFTPPAGYGVMVKGFSGDPAQRPLSGSGTRIVWKGQELTLPELTGSPVYLAVWDPAGERGEYNLLYDVVPDVEQPELGETYFNPPVGDGNDSGEVEVGDVTLALRMIVGLDDVTERRLRTLDVSPAKDGPTSQGDGQIRVDDAIRLLRRIVGLEPDPFP